MARLKITTITLLTWFFAAGCGQILNTANPEKISTLEVHILHGFEDHWLFVEGSDNSVIQTYVASPSTVLGERIVRYLEIHSDQSMLVVRRVPSDGNLASQSYCMSLQLDAGKNYVLRLAMENEQILTSLQEESFTYL